MKWRTIKWMSGDQEKCKKKIPMLEMGTKMMIMMANKKETNKVSL